MANIDDKVVAMSFENRKFEQGVSQTMGSLNKLKGSLQFPNAGKGLDGISAAANRLNLGHISDGVDKIEGKFHALSVAALAVFSSIAIKAVNAGANMVKAFTLGPLIAGFQEYSTNLNAVQTVLANTQASGAGLQDVNAALLQLNHYSDKTIYNFGQMARNIGTFTAAGVDLNTSVQSIKGIANLAALSGSNADQAATAMYQLSQAISAGRVGLQDWNSVVNAGMGGTVFQRALAQTAEKMGKLKEGSVALVGPMKNVKINGESFRESIGGPGPKWLTSDVLTNTLKQFTGDLTDAQLKAQGFNDAQIKSIQLTAKTAEHAATQVKTISQVFDVAKETIGSGWSQTFQTIFGDFGEAKTTFTDLSNAINAFVNTNANARNKVLADWKKLGGRTVLIESIKIAFKNLGEILKPIKDAFRDIFPAQTGKSLFDFTVRFKRFAESLKPSPKTVDELRRTFRGLFAVLDIGKQIIGGLFGFFKDLFHSVGGGSGSFLGLTASVGDFLVSIDKALKKGNALQNFFAGLERIVAIPINLLKNLAHALANLFLGFSPGGFSEQIGGMTKALTPFQAVLRKVHELWRRFTDSFNNAGPLFKSAGEAFVNFVQGIGPALQFAIAHMNFEVILETIRTGLLVGLFLMFRKFIGKGTFSKQLLGMFGKSFGKLGGGLLRNVNLSLKSFTGTMKAMQTNLQAKTLKEIAIAIALLAVSVLALSFVNPARLNASMTAIAVMLGLLLGSLKIMDTFISRGGAAKIPIVAASLILLAGAIDLMVIAVFALSRMSWDQLKKGLGGVTALLLTLTAASGPLSKAGPGLVLAGIGITAIAIGLNIMGVAVRQFGSMDLEKLKKGLGGIAASLAIVGLAVQGMPKTMVLQGAGLILVAGALNIMALAVKQFGAMDWKTIEKGLAGVGGSLVAIAIGMNLMPLSLPITALGLILVSVAIGKIAKSVAVMGGLSIRTLAKGIISLAGALGVLAASLHLMTGTLGGAIALGVAAAGIRLLTPALLALGKQSWKEIGKSLGALAAAFALIGIAGLTLGPVIPALLGFGAALTLIGAGLVLAGAGFALFGIGLSAVAASGSVAIGVLIKAIQDFLAAVPKMATDLAVGLLSMVQAFARVAPKFVDAMLKILNSLLTAIPKITPKLILAIEALVDVIVKVLHDKQDDIIKAAFGLLVSLLKGISNNIGQVAKLAGEIVVKLLEGVSAQAGKLITAGANVIISLVTGISNNIGKIITAGVNMAGKMMEGIAKGLVRLADKGAQALIDFLNGIAKVIDKREPEIIAAYANIGRAIIKGILKGLSDPKFLQSLYDKVSEIANKVKKLFGKLWKVFSPSQVMMDMGKNLIRGLVIGLDKTAPEALSAVDNMAKSMLSSVSQISLANLIDLQPRITPIIDLTEVRKGAAKMAGIVSKNPVGTVSLEHASVISFKTSAELTAERTFAPAAGNIISYEQNNYSPKALSHVEIYRQTRNQLSKIKELIPG